MQNHRCALKERRGGGQLSHNLRDIDRYGFYFSDEEAAANDRGSTKKGQFAQCFNHSPKDHQDHSRIAQKGRNQVQDH